LELAKKKDGTIMHGINYPRQYGVPTKKIVAINLIMSPPGYWYGHLVKVHKLFGTVRYCCGSFADAKFEDFAIKCDWLL
jgi:hypothetical protein